MSNAIKYLSKFKIFLMIVLYSILLIVVFLLVDRYIFINQTKKDLLNNSVSILKTSKAYSDEYFESKRKLINSLDRSQAFYDYLNDITIYQDNIKDLFLTVARNQKDIMQIRFIDYNGMEKVRVDRPSLDSRTKLIRNKNLQNKADRYYFTSEFNKKDEIWFSNLDLNMENGKVQVPFVPTIRIIKPIYNQDFFEGIIIINFFAQEFINKLSKTDLYDVAIFDSNAHIISHYNKQNNWTEYTNVDYELENKIGIKVKDIITTGEYITDEFTIKKLDMPIDNDFFIKYVLNEDYINKAAANKFDTYFIVLIFVFIIVFIFSYIVSTIFDRLIKDIVFSQDKAIKASRAKSEFLANMSHEIRTPLNGVLGLIQLTLDTTLNKKQSDYLYKAKSSSNALLTVINDILDYSKIEAGKLTLRNQEFILQNLLDNITDLFGFKVHEKGLGLRFQIDNKVPNILVSDSLRITQVLNNLIGNSIKFTHEGQIIIHIKELQKDEINKKTKLQFCVEDTGIGISENDLKKLFQSFTQAEDTNTKKYGGTGLGLTISKQLSTLLGGDVWCESQKGVGSKFYFTIECSYKDNLNSSEIKKFMSSKKFLIVDDDSTQITYLETILSSWNSQYISVNDGFKAIELMQKQKFDYILLDWNMPIINGVDVLKTLKEKNIDIPFVIMVTAFEKNELMDKLKNESIDINKVLSKPFTPSVLFEEIMNEVKSNDKIKNSLAVNLNFDAKILLVEDNEVNQLVASKYLEKFGVTVEIANDGVEATEMVKDTIYDLIFMDLQMPNMDGFEATKIIRESGIKTPIVALSAAVMQKDREQTSKVGMNKHIAKPIIIDELRDILLEYLTLSQSNSESNETTVNKDIEAKTEINVSNNFEVNGEKNEINIHGLDVLEFCRSTEIEEEDLIKMLESYYNSNKTMVDMLNTSDTKTQEFGKAIHKLKGSSGNFQLNEIYELCVSIENNLDKDLPTQDILDKLCTEVELTIESIRALIIKQNDDKQKENVDIKALVSALLVKAQEFSLITTNEINDIVNNLPSNINEDLKNELNNAFKEKDYDKIENTLEKIKEELAND